jgi:protein-tyrosine kinase
MSRIETILEKAVLMRDGKNTPPQHHVESPKAEIDASMFQAAEIRQIDNPYLVTATDPSSLVTEEYKKLKSMVLKFTNNGSFQNTIMVTSAVSCEGKSLTAINLAIALAQEYDHTVLLVDADMRKPSVCDYLGINPGIGLADCLTEGRNVSEALVKTGIGKLAVLPAGKKVVNPAELLSSSRMTALLKELKQRYDDRYIIFDTPPVLSFAEAHSLGSIMDGILFIVKEGGATKHNVQEALAMLKDTKIIGIVYNNVSISRFDSDYRYRSYYSYHQKGV